MMHIVESVRKGMRSGRLTNAKRLASELDVSWSTIVRDIAFLRDDARAPIEYSPERHGYRLANEAWQIPPMTLSRKELFSFAMASKVFWIFEGTGLDVDMRSVVDKVSQSLQGEVAVRPEALTEHLSVIRDDYAVQNPAVWNEVMRHVGDRVSMRMTYQRFDGVVKEYAVEPYHLLAYHGDWYLLARNADRDRIASFAVSRIRTVRGGDKRFSVPKDFDGLKYMQQAFGIVRGDKPFRVKLKVAPKIAAYIRERVWHPTQTIKEHRDGSLTLAFETAGWMELVRWILSWQPDMQVVSPKRLRQRIGEKLRQGIENAVSDRARRTRRS